MQLTFSFKLNLNKLLRFNNFHFSENKIEAPILHYKNNLLALHDEFLSINEIRLNPEIKVLNILTEGKLK